MDIDYPNFCEDYFLLLEVCSILISCILTSYLCRYMNVISC